MRATRLSESPVKEMMRAPNSARNARLSRSNPDAAPPHHGKEPYVREQVQRERDGGGRAVVAGHDERHQFVQDAGAVGFWACR